MTQLILTDDASSGEHRQLSAALLSGFKQTPAESNEDFIALLAQTNETQLLKQLVKAMMQGQDEGVRDRLEKALVYYMRQEGPDADYMMVIDCAQIIASSNQHLFGFLTTHLLPSLTLSPLYLQVLDFLCQLAQSRFSSDQGRYSQDVIQERRTRYQADHERRKRDSAGKLDPAGKKGGEEDAEGGAAAPGSSGPATVEGFKQERVVHEEKDGVRYTERQDETCTYSHTKKEFMVQHWYFCYTCKLVDNSGCCAVCARKCHKGHVIVYSKKSNFFCDCGDSGKCTSLKPQ